MTVGAQLRQARIERKLAVADVTQQTKIQPWVIESMESDRLLETMSPIYVKGFLSTYARFLRLDGETLLAQMPWPKPEGEPEHAAAPSQPAIPVTLRVSWPMVRRIGLTAALMAMVVGIVAVKPQRFLQKISLPTIAHHRAASGKPKAVASQSKPAAPKQVASASGKAELVAPAVAPVEASIAPVHQAEHITPPPALTVKPITPLELTMTATKSTWIVVRADGKLVTEQKLARGAKEQWTAKKRLEVIVAKPSQVDLLLNGQSITPFAIAHRGRLAITHQGVAELPEDDR